MFFRCLRIQARVIGALIMRELHTRFGRDDFGFLWFMGEPLIFATGVLVMWRTMRGAYEHDISVIPFVLLGYVPLILFRHAVGRALRCIWSNAGLLFHRQVTILDVFLSRMIVEIAGNLLAFVFAFFVLYAMGGVQWPANPALMYLGYFYMAWFSTGTALMVAALSERSEVVEKIWTPVSYLMVPICGCYMAAAWLPGHYRDYYLLMPTVHAFEMIRKGYFGDSLECYWSQPYVALASAITTLWGLYLFRQVRHHLQIG